MIPVRTQATSLFALTSLLLLATLAHAGATPVHPTVNPRQVEVPSLNHPIDLTRNLLVRAGDDPGFASPTLDDSQWLAVDTTRSLASYGIVHPDFVWYRTHVHVPPGTRHLSVLLQSFLGSAQVFVNGVPAGPGSSFPPGGRTAIYNLRSDIPDAAIASGDLTIAIRSAVRHSLTPGMISESNLLLGDQEVIANRGALFRFQNWTSNLAGLALILLLLVIAIALALSLRQNPEYLALVVYLAAQATMAVIRISEDMGDVNATPFNTFLWRLAQACTVFSLLEFSRLVLGIRRSRLIVIYGWSLACFFLFLLVFDQVGLRLATSPPPAFGCRHPDCVSDLITAHVSASSSTCALDRVEEAQPRRVALLSSPLLPVRLYLLQRCPLLSRPVSTSLRESRPPSPSRGCVSAGPRLPTSSSTSPCFCS